jgi:hypothetical protein
MAEDHTSAGNDIKKLKLNKYIRTFVVEVSASILFSLAYFILLGRTQSDAFSLNLLELSALVAFIYAIAVFVSSYRFEADLFPFYSLLRSFNEKSVVPLWLNIPSQFAGTTIGLLIYLGLHKRLLKLSPLADIDKLATFNISDPWMHALITGILVFILIYSILIIRKLFALQGMTGTLLIAILVFVLSAVSVPLDHVSVVTWAPDLLLNIYYMLAENGRPLMWGWPALLWFIVILVTTLIAQLKASQYTRPVQTPEESAEPGEFTPSFSKDYDI